MFFPLISDPFSKNIPTTNILNKTKKKKKHKTNKNIQKSPKQSLQTLKIPARHHWVPTVAPAVPGDVVAGLGTLVPLEALLSVAPVAPVHSWSQARVVGKNAILQRSWEKILENGNYIGFLVGNLKGKLGVSD